MRNMAPQAFHVIVTVFCVSVSSLSCSLAGPVPCFPERLLCVDFVSLVDWCTVAGNASRGGVKQRSWPVL